MVPPKARDVWRESRSSWRSSEFRKKLYLEQRWSVARGASARWSHGSERKINEGDTSDCSMISWRLNLFLEKPSQFQVRLIKERPEGKDGDGIEQDGGDDGHASVWLTDLSNPISLKKLGLHSEDSGWHHQGLHGDHQTYQ